MSQEEQKSLKTEGSQSESNKSPGNERHERFYFSDGNVTFLVGKTLFKVHRYFFQRDSDIFREMFNLTPPPGQEQEGGSDETPIKLAGQNRQNFECFLALLYPEDFADEHDAGFWLSCLHFAHKWCFEREKKYALGKIKQSGSPAHAIAAGRVCEEDNLTLAPFFAKMITTAPPSPEDAEILGFSDLLLLCRLQANCFSRVKASIGRNFEQYFDKAPISTYVESALSRW